MTESEMVLRFSSERAFPRRQASPSSHNEEESPILFVNTSEIPPERLTRLTQYQLSLGDHFEVIEDGYRFASKECLEIAIDALISEGLYGRV